jgi:hypothetical protein
MLKKQILMATILLFFSMLRVPSLFGACHEDMAGSQNIDQALASVPLPKITAEEAAAITKKYRSVRDENYTIVAIEWCKSSNFQPNFDDGTDWDDREAYAWFVTCVEPAKGPFEPPFDKLGIRSVFIMRIRDNRKVDVMEGVRT